MKTTQALDRTYEDTLPMRLGRYHRQWIYAVGGSLVASGIGWLIAHYLLVDAGSFGETHHPSEPWWLRLHGASVMAFLVVLGTILPGHVRRAWSMRKNCAQSVRKNVITGILMLSLLVVLTLTGYALYYSGDEDLRPYISTGHWVIGLVAAVGFYQHRRGRLQRGSKRASAKQAEKPLMQEPSAGGVLLEHHPQRHV